MKEKSDEEAKKGQIKGSTEKDTFNSHIGV
jgi:hypothetical protein